MQPACQAASSTDDNILMFRGTLKSDGLQPFVTSYFVYGCDCQSLAHQWCFCNSTFLNKHCLYLNVFIWQSVCADWICSDVNISEQTWQLHLSTSPAHTVPALPFRGILLSFWSEVVVDMICHTPLHRSGLSNTLILILIFIFYLNHPSFFSVLHFFVPPRSLLVLLFVSHHCEKINGKTKKKVRVFHWH